jgi:2',3'-cyclic-nucleotide 2'-phosphodiesterase (5'-nucleotidase family)
LIPVNLAIPDDPRTAEVVTSFSSRLPNELNRDVGATRAALDGIAQHLRASETNLGNLVADALRERTAANLSIVNAGGIRGDRLHPPGSISRRDLIEWHPFGNIVCVVSVPGRVLLEALNAGVSKLPAAAGQFPQVSGLVMNVDPSRPAGSRVRGVRVNGEPLDLEKIYTVAVPDFVLRGGDGYTMFAGHPVLVTPEAGDSMEVTMEKYLAARGPVNPVVEGRIRIEP